jgi:hypothetical protein
VIAEIMARKAGEPTLQGSGDEGTRTTGKGEDTGDPTGAQSTSLQIEWDINRSRTGRTRKPNTWYSGSASAKAIVFRRLRGLRRAEDETSKTSKSPNHSLFC